MSVFRVKKTLVRTVLVVGFAVLIFSCSTDTGVVAKFLGWGPVYFLGEVSYSLYLVHEIVDRTDKYVFKHHFSGSYYTPVNVCIYLGQFLKMLDLHSPAIFICPTYFLLRAFSGHSFKVRYLFILSFTES